jgi:hypothetical protein
MTQKPVPLRQKSCHVEILASVKIDDRRGLQLMKLWAE